MKRKLIYWTFMGISGAVIVGLWLALEVWSHTVIVGKP